MENLFDVVNHLNDYLKIADFADASQNGLQVEGKKKIKKIVGLVDASKEGFEAALDTGADMVIVHHGLLWGKPVSLTGLFFERVKVLIENGIALYAAHLPLDAHLEVGNNVKLIECIDASFETQFAKWQGKPIGSIGKFNQPKLLTEIIEKLDDALNTQSRVFDFGAEEISTVGVVSGSACEAIHYCKEYNVDLFITGEPRLSAFHEARELELNVAFAGHYATECVGIQALLERIPSWLDVETYFIDVPCEI